LTYTPKPIDTSKVTLPENILKLTELLANNAHENWAQQRFVEGWKYGKDRDELRKENPRLIPYEELPESEKEYDRTMAMETLKVMLALGYKIEMDMGEC
jgi:hypothetical protein